MVQRGAFSFEIRQGVNLLVVCSQLIIRNKREMDDLSEHCVKPKIILVHDPTAFAAFDDFLILEDEDQFLAASLFRQKPDLQELHVQHAKFVGLLKEHVCVMYLSEIIGNPKVPAFERYLRHNPNHIFTHDAIITIPWIPDGYILGNMKKPIRRDETIVLSKVAEILGYKEILSIPQDLYLEGGDVIPFCLEGRKILLVGYGPRTSEKTLYYFQETLIQDGWKTYLLFFAVSQNVQEDGHLKDLGVAILECIDSSSAKMGYPNDEGLPEHSLWNHGLSSTSTSVVEVVGSPTSSDSSDSTAGKTRTQVNEK